MNEQKIEDAFANDLLKKEQILLEQSSKHYQAWGRLGNDWTDLDRYEKAIACYEKAIELNPRYHGAWLDRAGALLHLGKCEDALLSCDKAIELNPHYHGAWLVQGAILSTLGRHDEAITSFDKAIQLKPNYHEAWYKRGFVLSTLGRHDEAITSYEKVTKLKPDFHEAWYNQGVALSALGRHDEAIISYEKVTKLKPDFHEAWYNRGVILKDWADYEKALISYNETVRFKPNFHEAWYGRGFVLKNLGCYEEAIASYDKAIEFKPDLHEIWNSRGVILYDHLQRYEEAVTSFSNEIQLNPSYHMAWDNRGIVLFALGRYEEAVSNHDEALRLTKDQYWRAWQHRGSVILASQGYKAALNAWDEGLAALLPTTPDYQYACGELHRLKGHTQYQEGRKQSNPFPDWGSARKSYLKTLEFWTFENPQFTWLHLEVLQELSTVTYLFNPQELQALLEEATAKLQRILQNPELTLGQKIALESKFAGFKQLQVTNLAQQNPTQALELAEARKNRCLGRLRDGWSYKHPEPTCAQIQTLLAPDTAIIYWHLSPAALTTFILISGQSPQVFQPKALTPAKQLQEFEEWMQQWKLAYQQHRDLDPEAMHSSPWRKNMEFMLYNRLRSILDINNLWQSHLKNINQLILIPHRDLHLLPLHALFPGRFAITYLPSAQIGLDLQYRESRVGDRILCVQDPTSALNPNDEKKNKPLKWAKREVDSIKSFYSEAQTSLIAGTAATKTALEASLSTDYDCLHFTGHGGHDIESPLNSALSLADDDKLTLEDIFQLKLQNYSLVCLSACETGITSNQEIIDEYIGLVSGFVSAGAAHVISTLWPVEDESSALLMIQFHRLLQQETLAPAQALTQAQKWLRTITYQDLSNWYQSLANELDTIESGCSRAEDFESLARKARRKFKDDGLTTPPYEHPYHWAGFTVTGKVPGG
jgi:CHAT domain-containing protein/Flp pilus assembly protein TadD